jgi:hypothetical protein
MINNKEMSPMSSFVNRVKEIKMSGDFLLAMLIGASVVIGDFILRHLPS